MLRAIGSRYTLPLQHKLLIQKDGGSVWRLGTLLLEKSDGTSPELRSVSLSSNDQAILNAIKAAYGTSSFATRFNAMQAFLAVKQETSETVAVFISRAREALCLLQSTRPSASLVTPTGSGPSIRLGTRIGSSLSLSC